MWGSGKTHGGKHTLDATIMDTSGPTTYTQEYLKALLVAILLRWRIAIWFVTCWHQQQTQATVSNSTRYYIAGKALPFWQILCLNHALLLFIALAIYTASACCYAFTTQVHDAPILSLLGPAASLAICSRSQATTHCKEPTTTAQTSRVRRPDQS